MTLIRNLDVCESTDLLAFAETNKLAHWNELHALIWPRDPDASRKHRHWFEDAFIVTQNFFNPEYMDDAYGLNWHPLVRDVVERFMRHHQLQQVLFLNGKNYSLIVL